ncbi:hypothetical protein Mcup_0693 [Metallosphaera cuprina Ar-4]|uniref:Uncharacterized protein n=1 Tax=Metallosphaera cuprina (strain Ar-4) TaxID=1006006 RepID=F4G1I5_METCR|nr:hypothetical protein Mcup_0693 [Metallosphaera cuprina Ar-4]
MRSLHKDAVYGLIESILKALTSIYSDQVREVRSLRDQIMERDDEFLTRFFQPILV